MYILERYMQIRPDAPRWWEKTFVKVWYGGGFGTKTGRGICKKRQNKRQKRKT
jgi:hypothetical protein